MEESNIIYGGFPCCSVLGFGLETETTPVQALAYCTSWESQAVVDLLVHQRPVLIIAA